jgi:hypothetical protein
MGQSGGVTGIATQMEPSMRKFEYDETGAQQQDVICYAFSPDLLLATEKELKKFLEVLSHHFPKTDKEDGTSSVMIESPRLLSTFNSAHQHVCELIQRKREAKRYCITFTLSIITLLVLAGTLLAQLLKGNC